MKVSRVTLRHVKMEMKFSFTTSFGSLQEKEFLLLEAIDEDGLTGWGESVAFPAPWYNEETLKTNWHMLEDFLIPALLHKEIHHPSEISQLFSHIRKNNMAKSTIEGAMWDLYAKQHAAPLFTLLGGKRKTIDVGVSIGIQKSISDLLEIIRAHVNEGYKRIKVKIKPGWDVDVLKEIRHHFPTLPLMADANSAYTLADVERLKELDPLQLLMIEQPLASDDIVDHAKLQRQITTPICLDESIHSYDDARKAIELGSCKIINIKIGRVGGLTEAKRIHDLCAERNVAVWCGGMLEAGIGRAHNVALSTLGNFILPGDTAGSARYWEKDIIKPEVIVRNGEIHVPVNPGIGYEPDLHSIEQYTIYQQTYS
ncbi:o-succinylbenzoate synthase [Salirhabdus salicampi]|uniref:o-succinylbenzoate synthase n=1 Tax=Salirhabdus salicampi TaxID=476102 RepID=UPI0020C28573|nr:o-succinylbenzoate synthase [Salirhabdus salicampi]MCP8616183.1 o-succinylbenzoate synthase [Salirhabdus salicampi]